MSNGEGTGSKPKRGFAATKEKYENRIAELEAKIAEQDAREAEAVTVADLSPPPVTVPAEPKEPESEFLKVDCSRDCLAHITKDVQYVSFASTFTNICIRRGVKDAQPPLIKQFLRASEVDVWFSNPFPVGREIVGPDPDGDQRAYDTMLKAQKSKYWMHRLTRSRARQIWTHPLVEKPTHTVLLPEKFEGYDKDSWEPVGELDPIEEFDPLRELTRMILMRVSETFMDWGRKHHNHHFDPRFPNPYRNRIPGLPATPVLPPNAQARMSS